jgi:hypothetical protein
MQQYAGYVDEPGLQQALAAAGVGCWWEAGTFYVSDLAKAQSLAASYDPLPAIQQAAVATVAATLAARIAAGFTYNGVRVDCTKPQTDDITSVASMADNILSGRITTAWAAKTWPAMTPGAAAIPLPTAQSMIDFGAAIGSFVGNNKFHAADLTAQIMASTATAASIAALDLDNSKGTWPTS